ncbi:MAG: glycosyltransferase [Acidobacteria bacterium]|nr:glycosyltransferase [Acidobacteriota bacterium]
MVQARECIERGRVSVVIPTFNRPVLLAEAVRSVLAQTVPVYEIVVVDDDSERSHYAAIDRLRRLDPRVKIHRLPRQRGAGAARNHGIEASGGDFVIFLDDDDLLDPRMVESSLRSFGRYPECDVVTCGSNIFTSNGTVLHPVVPATFVDPRTLERHPFSQILLYGIVIHSCMVRRRAIANVRFPEDLCVGEDSYFWLQVARDGSRFKTTPGAYALVRRHDGNATASASRDVRVKEFYRKLIREGMVQDRADEFFARAQLSARLARRNDVNSLTHWIVLARWADLLPRFLWIYVDAKLKRARNALRLRCREMAVFPQEAPAESPRLLFISPVVPSPTGSGIAMRAFNNLSILSQRNSVDLLVVRTSFGGCELPSATRSLCRAIICLPLKRGRDWDASARWYARALLERLGCAWGARPIEWICGCRRRARRLCLRLRADRYDVIHVFRLYMNPVARLLCRDGFRGVRQLDLDDVESRTRARIGDLPVAEARSGSALRAKRDAEWYAETERNDLAGHDRVFVCSEADRAWVAARDPRVRIEVLPNVYEERLPKHARRAHRPFTFLFVGSLGYAPNIDGVSFFVERIAPLIAMKAGTAWRFRVAGRGVTPGLRSGLARYPFVELVGEVSSVEPLYRSADAAIVPIRAGGGTRIKVIEAFAYGVPVVTTTLGVEGLGAASDNHVLIGDNEDELAAHCARLMYDPDSRARLACNARRLLRAYYSPALLARVLHTACWEAASHEDSPDADDVARAGRRGTGSSFEAPMNGPRTSSVDPEEPSAVRTVQGLFQ